MSQINAIDIWSQQKLLIQTRASTIKLQMLRLNWIIACGFLRQQLRTFPTLCEPIVDRSADRWCDREVTWSESSQSRNCPNMELVLLATVSQLWLQFVLRNREMVFLFIYIHPRVEVTCEQRPVSCSVVVCTPRSLSPKTYNRTSR